jgi:predicted transglutaminase-like cysteine proteinase
MIRHRLSADLLRRIAIAALVAAALPASSSAAGAFEQVAAVSQTYLFGSREIHSANLKMFPKWRGTLQRFEEELKSCETGPCRKKQWQAVIEGLRGKDLMTQLRELNTEMNDKRYITDPVNWNLPDYWATPFQFLRKNGDCEDYAIAKFMALRALGVPTDVMRIVVLNDLNLGLAHAILVVEVDGTPMVLDNQIKGVVAAASIHHYQPVYAVTDKGWWLYDTGG